MARWTSPQEQTEAATRESGIGIGALAHATGIPVETLRTWERRYGFPAPLRDEGGQRVYPDGTVSRLLRVRQALERGHRANKVLPLDELALQRLISRGEAPEETDARALQKAAEAAGWAAMDPAPLPSVAEADAPPLHPQVQEWMALVSALDAEGLDTALRRAWTTLGPLPFLQERAGPFLDEVGHGWASGRLTVAHEHFASERLRSFLTAIWTGLAPGNRGPTVLCATLSGEQHVLGLHMAACVLALAGLRLVFLGADLPAGDLARVVAATQASHAVCAVLVSVSSAIEEVHARNQLAQLRRSLPRAVVVVAGGSGAPHGVQGVERPESLAALWQWAELRSRSG